MPSSQIDYNDTDPECRGLALKVDGTGVKLADNATTLADLRATAYDRATNTTPRKVRHHLPGEVGQARLATGESDITTTDISLIITASGTVKAAGAGDAGKPSIGKSCASDYPGRGITYTMTRDGKKYVHYLVGAHAVT